MQTRIRIDGIYDIKIIQLLKELGISDHSFDFRPRSFNFIQQHQFMDILHKSYSPLNKYYLHFCDEVDFVVEKIIRDTEQGLGVSCHNNFILEFSDNREIAFYDSFQVPFYFHYRQDRNLSEIMESTNLKGLILHYSLLEEMHEKGTLMNFVHNFHQMIWSGRVFNFDLGLFVDWNSNIFPSIFDLFDFNFLALPVNAKVEIGYRNANLDKIRTEVKHYHKLELGL